MKAARNFLVLVASALAASAASEAFFYQWNKRVF